MISRALVVTFLIAVCSISTAQDWTRFRGPNGSGISQAKTVPVKWTADDYNWRVELPGEGHSSPVIWGDRLFITSAEAGQGSRWLICLDTADGSEHWRMPFPFSKYKKHRVNTFATNTPAVDADAVYVLWQAAEGSALYAVDHRGQQKWKYDLGKFKGGHGTGTSPIVHQDMVVVCNDHDGDNSFLAAVDRKTGGELWRMRRIGDRACYSTPCVYAPEGQAAELIFTHSYRGITGVDPAGGKQRWEIDVFGTFKQRAIGSPVIYGDLVIGTSGFTTAEKNLVAVRPKDTPAGRTVEEVYRISRQVPHIPTPLVVGDRLYLWSDTGIVTCFNAADGEKLWQQRVGGTVFGSPICVDGKIYLADRDGVVTVLAAGDKYELLAQNELGDATHATPAVSGGVIYFRTLSHVISLGGK